MKPSLKVMDNLSKAKSKILRCMALIAIWYLERVIDQSLLELLKEMKMLCKENKRKSCLSLPLKNPQQQT